MNELERSLAFVASPEELAYLRAMPRERLPRFAVVIPSLNQAEFIGQTIDSVLAQNYPALEIYVADGGSSDGTLTVLQSYATRYPDLIRYDSRPDGGQYQGVNKGIANTSGDIIAWINSDDVYLPETFWKVAAFFYYNRCAYVVYGRNRYVDRDLAPITDYPVDWSPILHEQRRRMMHFCIVPQPSLFFRRVAVTLCGALASRILDYELWLRWQQSLPFYFYDDDLSLSRLHGKAVTANADRRLLEAICETVHQYYGVVPYSWAMRCVSTWLHGAAWARGESPRVDFKMRALAGCYWIWLNLRWFPRVARRGLRGGVEWLRQVKRMSS